MNVNLDEEIQKAKVAVKYHADTMMDLSDGGDVGHIRRTLLDAAPITFGTVPIYEAYNYGITVHKNPLNLTEDDYLNAFENNARDGVDYTTIHCGITKAIAKRILHVKRHGGVVSKGGTITAAWMLKHDKENPYLTHYDYLMEIAKKYDVTFSLGDALRPGSILDSHDELQVQEMINISQLTKRAHQQGVQVMVEGPGHVPLNEVAANVRLAKSLIGDVPYYVLGPLVTGRRLRARSHRKRHRGGNLGKRRRGPLMLPYPVRTPGPAHRSRGQRRAHRVPHSRTRRRPCQEPRQGNQVGRCHDRGAAHA